MPKKKTNEKPKIKEHQCDLDLTRQHDTHRGRHLRQQIKEKLAQAGPFDYLAKRSGRSWKTIDSGLSADNFGINPAHQRFSEVRLKKRTAGGRGPAGASAGKGGGEDASAAQEEIGGREGKGKGGRPQHRKIGGRERRKRRKRRRGERSPRKKKAKGGRARRTGRPLNKPVSYAVAFGGVHEIIMR